MEKSTQRSNELVKQVSDGLQKSRLIKLTSNQRHVLTATYNYRVPGEIKRREVELDPQVSPEEIMSREVAAGLRKLDFFRFGLFLNSSATDIVLVTLPKHGS